MEKRVSLKNNLGKRIVGILNVPKGKPPFSAVVICHGLKGYKEQRHLKTLACELEKNKILALRFDFTNEVGQSAGNIENLSFSQELKDLKSVIDYLTRQKIVDHKRIGLAGHSLGGQIILTYAPSDGRVKALADLAGVTFRDGTTNTEKTIREQMPLAKETGYFFVYSGSKRKKFKIKCQPYTNHKNGMKD